MIFLAKYTGGDKIVDFFFAEEIINSMAESIIVKVSAIAAGMAVLFFFLSMAWNYMVTTAKRVNDGETKSFVDKFDLARCGLLLVCIGLYSTIAGTVVNFSEAICKSVTPSEMISIQAQKVANQIAKQEELRKNLRKALVLRDSYFAEPRAPKELLDSYAVQFKTLTGKEITCTIEVLEDYTEEVGLGEGSERSIWQKILDALTLLAKPGVMMGGLASFIMIVIRMVIYKFTIMYVRVLICVGPLAFAFSMIPAFKDKVSVWFGTVLNGLFVFLTLNIIECIVCGGMINFAAAFYDPVKFTPETMAFGNNLACIVLYLMAFKITAKYVGTGDAGAAVSKGMGIVTAAAAVGVMAATGGAAAPVAGGAVANTTSTVAQVAQTVSKTSGNAFSGNES